MCHRAVRQRQWNWRSWLVSSVFQRHLSRLATTQQRKERENESVYEDYVSVRLTKFKIFWRVLPLCPCKRDKKLPASY